MGLFHAARRVSRWPVVLPLYDGRACPECAAVVIGGAAAVIAHRDWHEGWRQTQDETVEAMRQVAIHAGMSVGEGSERQDLELDQLGLSDKSEYIALAGRRNRRARLSELDGDNEDEDWED